MTYRVTCLGKINENEKIVLDIILKAPNITIAEIANQSNKSIRTINRIINSLKEKNLLKRMNSNKDGYWEVLKWLNGLTIMDLLSWV